ncbi:hypothetical protein LTR65_004366 [Meristemomyces frigidus]
MELPETEPIDVEEECPIAEDPSFSFGDLQHVQFVEEKAAEVLLVLKANSNIITQLRDTYLSITDSEDFGGLAKDSCRKEAKAFAASTSGLVAALTMQQSRAESLVRLVAERKSLLYGILQYQNMEANRLLAEKAHVSALRMEEMTHEMQIIAHKTKAETVSMRIITLVTLFFLPGTFISTLMSTPIVTFDTDSPGFSGKNIGTDEFPVAHEDPNLFSKFFSEQWRFCSNKLERLDSGSFYVKRERVLPLLEKRWLASGVTASLHHIVVHPDYDNLRDRDGDNAAHHEYALKTYRGQHAERYYSTEVHNFAQLTSRASTSTPGLIGFYGGFEHGDTFNILLEYANGGTLEDMFQQREPPSCGDDIIAFWNAFVEVLKALASIHDLKKEASDTMGHKVFQGYVV